MKIITVFLLLSSLGLASSAQAQSGDSLAITYGAFVDTYFMYDFNNLPGNAASHPFTTPLRHNEFNVNLAHVEVRGNSQHIRGALALHTGTSVKANYAAESNNRELAQLIHEAWAGVQAADGLWIDAGIYPSPYGFESWLTRDNKTYSPSLVTNGSPFYQTGIRITWQASDVFSAGINLINGWQNISENNSDKALGISLGLTPSSVISFVYNNFIGNEQPSGTPAELRFYNDLTTRIIASPDLQFDLTTDYGMQKKDGVDASWMGAALIGQVQLSAKLAISGRIEYYKDEHQIILVTGSANGFDGFGVSVNGDLRISKALLWRIEGRMLKNKTEIFHSQNGSTDQIIFLVSSLAISL